MKSAGFCLHKVVDAGILAYYGLHSLQHRGQEACGIATSDGKRVLTRKDKGLVTDVFDKAKLDEISDNAIHALGHVLYNNYGSNIQENIQPIMVRSHQGTFALAHNGEIVNAGQLRYELEQEGSIFQGTSDTEIVAHLIQRAKGSMAEKILAACKQMQGAYSMVIMTKNTMYAVRDPLGLRPLCLARLNGGYAISSESCAFTIVNADFVRDIRPGELLKMGKEQFESCNLRRNACLQSVPWNIFISPARIPISIKSMFTPHARLAAANWLARTMCKRISS